MKLIKKLWEKLGQEKLPVVPITVAITLLTVIQLFILEIPDELRALMVMLNGVLILIAMEEN